MESTRGWDTTLAGFGFGGLGELGEGGGVGDGQRGPELAVQQDLEGLQRYAGVSRLNLAAVLLWLGETEEAVAAAGRAESDLGCSSGVSTGESSNSVPTPFGSHLS